MKRRKDWSWQERLVCYVCLLMATALTAIAALAAVKMKFAWLLLPLGVSMLLNGLSFAPWLVLPPSMLLKRLAGAHEIPQSAARMMKCGAGVAVIGVAALAWFSARP